MKKEVSLDKASRLINCGPLVLITAAYKDKVTITPCAWHMPVSKVPPAVGIALAKSHFSSELIRKSEEFIINVPDNSLLDKVMGCGTCSGRSSNKFSQNNFTPQKALKLLKTPKIAECIGHIECAVIDIKDIGDHFIFLGEIIKAEAEEDYFKDGFWDTTKVKLLFHLGAKFFFNSSVYTEFNR